MNTITNISFIDLFAGLGGIRLGFEQAASELGLKSKCVLTSEIKPSAIEALHHKHPEEEIANDVRNVFVKDMKDTFDVVLGGFPCQAFSVAGKGLGFMDTRGTLFLEIERLIAEATAAGNKPKGFILENVEGLVTHGEKVDDPEYPGYGSTLITIIKKLKKLT